MDDLVLQYMEEHQIPGLCVSIVQAPYITRVVGYGLADVKTKRKMGSHTLFPIGQMTRAYTAVAIMQLIEMGKLNLEDPISKYLLKLPQQWETVKVKDLVTHTSGLPNYMENTNFNYSKDYSFEQIVELVRNKPFNFPTGTNSYSSATDYYLLAAIIDQASGMSYESFVTKYQFEKMGLRSTCFLSNINTIPNELGNGSNPFKHSVFKTNPLYINPSELATGYATSDHGLIEAPIVQHSSVRGYGCIVSTAEEISIWDVGLAGDILITNSQHRQFIYNGLTLSSGQKIPGNAGWIFPGHPGMMYIQGVIPGFCSHLSRYTDPTELLCVTVLANQGNLSDVTTLSRQIAGFFNSKLSGPTTSFWSSTTQSPYSVSQTIERLSAILVSRGVTIFAEVDHQKNANSVQESLPDARVLIIGNPHKGTDLMKQNMSMTLELPLRIAVWLDKSTQEVWIQFTDPVELAHIYDLQGQNALTVQMRHSLADVIKKAIAPDFIP